MTVQDLYTTIGGNYNEAKGRLMNDRLIDRFVGKFLDDPTAVQLTEAVAAGNIEESFRAAHTLKGVAANMAFTRLSEAASQLTEQLRPRAEQADQALVDDVMKTYNETVDAIRAYQAQKA